VPINCYQAEFLLNTLLFALGGLIWAAISFSSLTTNIVGSQDYGWLLLFYVLILAIRFFQVGLFYPILSRIGLKSNWKEGVFLAYGGLHGSVGVALGLNLVQNLTNKTEEDDPRRTAATILQFFGGGATLLTLLINGTSAGFILKKLGLSKPSVPVEHVKQIFEGAAKDYVYTQIENLFQEPRFQNVSFDVLKESVPFVTKEPPRISGDIEGVRHNHGTSIHQFNQRIAGEGKQYMSLLKAARRASDHGLAVVVSEKHKNELLIIEMRQIFLELLREAYKLSHEFFELDQKQHNGFLFDVLTQSVDLAINDVRYDHKPIDDWQHTEIFFRWNRVNIESYSSSMRMSSEVSLNSASQRDSNLRRRTKTPNKRESGLSLGSSLRSLVSFDNNTADKDVAKAKISVKRLRLDVLRAIAFQRGHEMAESKLQLYVNRFDDEEDASMQAQHQITTSALKQVLSESRDQVRFADEMLEDEVSDKDLEIILSYYCAKIVIRRLSKFIECKAEEGLIGKQDARNYMRTMNEKANQTESRTVERLAELRLERSKSKHLSSLESIHDDVGDIKTSTDCKVDPHNSDTIGANNTKSNPNSTPLTALFDTPLVVISVSSMPQIEEADDEIEEEKDRCGETLNDENNEKKEDDTCEAPNDDSSYASA
jgi:hypothetical protein